MSFFNRHQIRYGTILLRGIEMTKPTWEPENNLFLELGLVFGRVIPNNPPKKRTSRGCDF